jgi:flagellar basal body-associated protein FliL
LSNPGKEKLSLVIIQIAATCLFKSRNTIVNVVSKSQQPAFEIQQNTAVSSYSIIQIVATNLLVKDSNRVIKRMITVLELEGGV